ncbi:MAG: MopE-related protein [Bacteroidota bacterium]
MKKLITLFYLCLLSFYSYGQVVNIPDANFLAALIEEGVDTNEDGLIQNSEAEVVDTLYIKERGIVSLEGINAFTNLEILFADENNITTMSLDLPKLIYIGCTENNLTMIDLSRVPSLELLYCRENMLTELDLRQLPLLTHLSCGDNQLTSLDVSLLPNLTYLNCPNNDLNALDVSTISLLTTIGCTGNNIKKLDLRTHSLLRSLVCVDNELDTVQLGSHPELHSISCSGNRITELNLDSLPALKSLGCGENQLTTIDVSDHFYLESFSCNGNDIEELELRDLPLLRSLNCHDTKLKSLDITEVRRLYFLRFGNPELAYVNLVDDFHTQITVEGDLEGLNYLCADSLEVEDLEGELDLSNIVVNENCFENYESYINVSGSAYYGQTEACENAIPISNALELRIELESGTTFIHHSTESTYEFKLPPNYESTIQLHNLDTDLFNSAPDFYSVNSMNNINSLDFCIYPTDLKTSNVCLSVYTTEAPSSGFEHTYTIDYVNLGNKVSNGVIRFEYDASIMNFTENAVGWSISPGVLEMNFSDLEPLEKRSTELVFLLNSPMDTPPLFGGEILEINSTLIVNDVVDIDPDNNLAMLKETVVNSFDPNDKTCLQGNAILDESSLSYRIRFENTGTGPARNIIIRDTIDNSVFDIESFQVLKSSHPVSIQIVENIIEFQFVGVYLPFEDDENDGFVIFSIDLLEDLEVGRVIENSASIYFDFNWPIHTNVVTSELVEDADGDGFHNLDDCDDTNEAINPDAIEAPYNGIDDDCDPMTLDDDLDQDGFLLADDCDDANEAINPDAMEAAYNGIDDDCDPMTLDDDLDQDGFLLADDCDDTNEAINPDQTEEPYNGIDDDCDPKTLNDDLDQDGFLLADDCDDTNETINPDEMEEPYNGIDDDCNPLTLDDDLDQDGFLLVDDCDDNNAEINPNAEEIPNNDIDENCDGEDLILSIHEIANAKVNIFPNPAANYISLEIEGKLDYLVLIYDMNGKSLIRANNAKRIDLSNLTAGTYLIEVSDNNSLSSIVERLVVVK